MGGLGRRPGAPLKREGTVKHPWETDHRAWDQEKDRRRLDSQSATLELGPRPFGPMKRASDRCQSGRRDYCTCDTCF